MSSFKTDSSPYGCNEALEKQGVQDMSKMAENLNQSD